MRRCIACTGRHRPHAGDFRRCPTKRTREARSPRDSLHESSGKRALRIWMDCKAQNAAIAAAIARFCNAADRPRPQMHRARRFVQRNPRTVRQAQAGQECVKLISNRPPALYHRALIAIYLIAIGTDPLDTPGAVRTMALRLLPHIATAPAHERPHHV